uniref:Ovomucoid n=1 Tax=Geospiza parvula TaxID=87175 RepID=A0A8C3N1L5_GEOPR
TPVAGGLSTCVLSARPSPGLRLFPPQVDCSRYPNSTSEEGKVVLICNKDISPVCGTDWVTYDNECLLCARMMFVLSVASCGHKFAQLLLFLFAGYC